MHFSIRFRIVQLKKETSMRNLRIISCHFSRGIERNPVSNRLISIQSRRYSSVSAKSDAGIETEKKEVTKTAFDVMLQSFEADSKIKVIKEVKSVTDLELVEAKALIEKAPIMVKKRVSKEEAEKIIEKLKAVGAKVSMWS